MQENKTLKSLTLVLHTADNQYNKLNYLSLFLPLNSIHSIYSYSCPVVLNPRASIVRDVFADDVLQTAKMANGNGKRQWQSQ